MTTLAQGPATCCELGRDIKWTTGKVGTVDCTADSPCVFEKDIAVGEEIKAGQCGEDAVKDAECAVSETTGKISSSCITDKWGMLCLLNTIYNITDWIFVILMALAVIFVIIGAFTLVTAAGSPEKVSSGRNYIMYAAIGIVVALLARAIPALVKMIVGA
jgi:hypothetical protein